MLQVEVSFAGIENLSESVNAFDQKSRAALNTAIRVEGYRLMRSLQRQIRSGAPGGRRFAPLSFVARIMGHRGRNEPLKALSQAVKYQVAQSDPIDLRFGFVGPVNRSQMREMNARSSQLISKSWLAIAAAQQSGFDVQRDDLIRRGSRRDLGAILARAGAKQENRRWVHHSRTRYFFLRKSTRTLRTPRRPIISPFWSSEASGAKSKIEDNFRRKMAGERI